MTPSVPDETRTEELLLKLRDRMVNYLRAVWGDQAADRAQDAVVIYLERYRHVKEEGQLAPVMFTIASFLVKAARSHRDKAQQPPEETGFEQVSDERPNPEEEVVRQERLDRLYSAIARLRDRCRDLMMYRLKEWSSEQIAKMLGITVNRLYGLERDCRDDLRNIMMASERPKA